MKLLVTDIEFDLDDDYDMSEDDTIQFKRELQLDLQERAIGLWDVDSEDELVDKITDTTGWGGKSIDYQPNAPHSLTAFM